MREFMQSLAALIFVAGCAPVPTTEPGSPDWSNHPANPDAPAAPLRSPSTTLSIDPAAMPIPPATTQPTEHEHHGHGGHP
jgi:hypothetical protein